MSKSTPLPKEAIQFIDQLMAKHLLVAELSRIPEFLALWEKARATPDVVMETIRPKLQELFSAMSPEGRGAFMSLDGEAYRLYDKDAIQEARNVLLALQSLSKTVNQELEQSGLKTDYRAKLEAIALPLGVPALVDVMMAWDFERWGLDRMLHESGPVTGPVVDLIESGFIREFTDLSPAEAAMATQGTIRRRVKQKAAPVGRHLKRYKLRQRVHLWVRNVVYGETQEEIALCLEKDENWDLIGYSPDAWVRRQIQEANRILSVRRKGRPRKGGVLHQWKMTAE